MNAYAFQDITAFLPAWVCGCMYLFVLVHLPQSWCQAAVLVLEDPHRLPRLVARVPNVLYLICTTRAQKTHEAADGKETKQNSRQSTPSRLVLPAVCQCVLPVSWAKSWFSRAALPKRSQSNGGASASAASDIQAPPRWRPWNLGAE